MAFLHDSLPRSWWTARPLFNAERPSLSYERSISTALQGNPAVLEWLSVKKDNGTRVSVIWGFEARTRLEVPLFTAGISAGFPSPADDFIDRKLDLNEFLIAHPAATFFVRVEGTSMIDAGIHPGDILIVDRAVEPRPGSVVIAVVDGEFTVKRYHCADGRCFLLAENPRFSPIEVTEDMAAEVWGVVSYVIHKV
jgi:DNA polymerase V